MEANDMKAMREALEETRGVIEAMGGYWAREKLPIIDVALSKPPRNCDRFADAETARQAWLDDVENWDDFGSPKLELHEWLFASSGLENGS